MDLVPLLLVGGAEGVWSGGGSLLVGFSSEKVTLAVEREAPPESPQKLPPIFPNMSLAKEESPPLPDTVVGVAVGVVEEPPPRAEVPVRKELRVESERRESPSRERGAESLAVDLLDCPDL